MKSVEQKRKELLKALKSAKNDRKEDEIPPNDIYWEVKRGLDRL